mgnify:CR=1 FL=1
MLVKISDVFGRYTVINIDKVLYVTVSKRVIDIHMAEGHIINMSYDTKDQLKEFEALFDVRTLRTK